MQIPNAELLPDSVYADVPELSQAHQARQPAEWFYKPVMIDIELTHRCNLRCAQCDILEDVKKGLWGLEADIVIDLLQQAEKAGIYCYGLTGGEPFLRLPDILKIIERSSQLDCHKIQTNGTIFTNPARTERVLRKLHAAGFGSRNRWVKSALRCSIGIQNYRGGAPESCAFALGRKFYEVFSSDQASLGYTMTFDISQDPLRLRAEFIERFRRANSFYPFEDLYHLRAIMLHENAESPPAVEQATLETMLGEYSRSWKCVDSNVPVPWPRLLVRASGDTYSCSCFGHVFKIGNIRNESLLTLITRANHEPLFKMIGEQGLISYLDHAEQQAPGVSKKLMPVSSSPCQICRTVKQSIERKPAFPIL
jgi:MoaA/NifB/PqqE/SkfB family radical SAM enzyme